jgi:hypothetical protein
MHRAIVFRGTVGIAPVRGAQIRFFTPFAPARPGTQHRDAPTPTGGQRSSHVEDWRQSVADVPLPKRTREKLEQRAERAKEAERAHNEAAKRAAVPDGAGFTNLANANDETKASKKVRSAFMVNNEQSAQWAAVMVAGIGGCCLFLYAVLSAAEQDRKNTSPYPPPPEIRKHAAERQEALKTTPPRSPPAPTESRETSPEQFAVRAEYAAVEADVFEFLEDGDYSDLGFVDRSEVALTVAPHAFTQYGIIVREAVEKMLDDVKLGAGDVFVDVGSGIGNVVLQAVAVTDCPMAVGVELLPSRLHASEKAERRARERFPRQFPSTKRLTWIEGDVVAKFSELAATGPTVIFTHSWMFDDALLAKLGDMWSHGLPTLRAVVSSRPLPGFTSEAGWDVEKKSYAADWNPEAPFFVYSRRN